VPVSLEEVTVLFKNWFLPGFVVVLVPVAIAQTQIGAAARVALMQDDAGIVQGEPCAVVEEVETARQLPDGTTISRHVEERKWRDSEGRFRRETAEVEEGQKPDFEVATIIDPVNNTLTVLHFDRKEAIVYHLPDQGPFHLHPYLDPFDQPLLARPGVQVKTEKLDGKEIAGVYAVGRRVTRTRPPGTVGNDKPLISVAERWISPDLKIMLLQWTKDPREDETRQVTSLDRGNPDPQQFLVPASFAVREVTVDSSQK
jgi:hypothetical protein